MADTTCFSGIKACRIRLVRLDSCGRPVSGPSSVAVSSGFVSVTATADIEEGEEFLVKNACGEACINEKDCDFLKRYNLAINFCKVDPTVLEMTTSQRALLDGGGNVIGTAYGSGIQCEDGWSLELWQKLAGVGCDAGGTQLWNYWAWPWLTSGTLGDLTFENGPFTFDVNARTKAVGAGTWDASPDIGTESRGPFSVFPVGAGLLAGEHVAHILTDVQPPADQCGTTAYDDAPTAPDAPIMELAARSSATSATVVFDPPAEDGGSPITGYTATSSPGGITGTGASSPVEVTGLTTATPYTFTVKATNAVGDSVASAASNSVTP